ncbi:hypothetical protein METBIDRAFT_226804 [Metschnikowia bicuspidata var. bicuspidata NRRL YB-4993]|uniref:C2H2-type domain-containing protein n=1 Tax=Metschnikowia bicuspidata var. bicuspidata NRRL YB-4993 TaxID=869754 RepID=A0A1A0H1W3_9ASCO|nr:hypothetical protein METBIDRAFT_226804 [Metschnikowia bicuspidata var. bicuspidata NRRL YB-4993]OBA18019.1 hypothetical protein METBIDRAFT_226804 [Metschnikowia bicuspidata var. bicuspidata NRRL YB-4993]
MAAPVLLQRSAPMDLLRQPNAPPRLEISPEPPADRTSVVEGVVPKEFTAQGTTPSGKPRLFVCAMCTRAFARLEHLRRHERSHTKERPFDCGVCQRKFSRRDLLLRHAQKLHAGCDDAVARMRRKLSRAHMSVLGAQDAGAGAGLAPATRKPSTGVPVPINFNHGSFSARHQDAPGSPGGPPPRKSRLGSVKDAGLKKQLFDKRKPGFRRASFSAQSGPNYAMVPPQLYTSSTAENVEFSTPQILPSFASDEDSWLNSLCAIPGMSPLKLQPVINEQTQAYSFEHEFPKHTAMFGGGMLQNVMHSESIGSSSPTGNIEPASAHPPFMAHCSSFAGNPANPDGSPRVNHEFDATGYSFYDIPDSFVSNLAPKPGTTRSLFPIRHELEDDLMDLDNLHPFSMKTMSVPENMANQGDFSLNHLDDINDLDQFFNDGGKTLLGGYSFYGDNPLIPSTGLESMSSHASASPSNMHAANPQLLAKPQYQQNSHLGNESRMPIEDQLENANFLDYGHSKTSLFTRNMRYLIKRTLNKYPISDVPPPCIPTNEKLEFYVRTFIKRFLSYFPFIHPSRLNEFDIMDMTSDEDPQNESARICLPLLAATLGALLANNKIDLDQLYEASRRTVHIYLESRKTGKKASTSGQQSNPLWLIQSLTLSVLYGLFSDSENNIHIVIRQHNALNSLVKTSIKNNQEIFFAISGQDQTIYNFAKRGDWHAAREALNYASESEVKFKHAIAMQSQIRSALTIYQLTNFILMMFNVPLTLSAAELGSLTCPNTHDELLWGFSSYNELSNYLQTMGVHQDIDFFLAKNESNTIVFQEVLKSVCQHHADKSLSSKLLNLSKFGFNCLAKGVYEFMQYEDYNFMDVGSVLNHLTFYIDSPSRNPHTHYLALGRSCNEKYDYALIANFVEICSLIDFRMVKEQSWLKNYDILNKNYHALLNHMESVSDTTYLKVIHNCIAITKLVMFKTEESGLNGKSNANDFQTDGYTSKIDKNSLGSGNSESTFEKSLGLRVLDVISCDTSPINSQVIFHVFLIYSIFAVYVAKRNNPATQAAQGHNFNETWQLNQTFLNLLNVLGKFEEHLRLQFENRQLQAEMANIFLLLPGNTNDMRLENASPKTHGRHDERSNAFAYNLEKTLYVLRIGELMMKMLYDQNIKVIILKRLSCSMSQIRKYLIDEEAKILS